MSNKDKQTMDYWRHSTNLFEETKMELAMNSLIKDKENIETEIAIQESLQETPINYEIVANHLNKLFDYDSNDHACKKLIFDTFINKVIIYDDDNIVIICNFLDKSLKRKNEHQLNMVFDYDSHGAANKFLNEHIYYTYDHFYFIDKIII